MSQSITELFGEAQTHFDAKEWKPCRAALEAFYARNYRVDITAMYLGDVCFADGDVQGSLKWHRQALELNEGLAQALEHMIFVKDAQPDTTAEEALALRREWWNRFGQVAYAARRPPNVLREPDRVLRVGYVSGDFKFHSASSAFATTVTGHTHQIDPFFYSTLEPEHYDALSHEWRKGYADSWREVSEWPVPKLVQQIRTDKIDILVDLSGFTGNNRLLAFAARPAPIQIQAWGYALGAGCPALDVVFADPIVANAAIREQLTERVVDLPTLLSYFPRPDLPEASPLPCVTESPVFAVFNRAIKVNAETLAVWRQILDRVPEARIRFQGFDYSETIKAMIREALGKNRVWFTVGATDRLHKLDYLDVDLALDPWPQTGGVSTLDALWMGVPTVTLLGPRMIQRASASFLTVVGLETFITETPEDYIETAVQWVTTRRHDLAVVRASLRATFRGSLIITGYVQAVETAYRSLWQEYCQHGQIRKAVA